MKTSKRGGARPGSGRKALGKVRLTLNVRKETKRALDREARVNKTTLGGVIDAVFSERIEIQG